ncbi:dihydroxyacetone kinase subunit L [Actinobaculum sp. 313]|uniref:dihydroxyacetone kinase subunit L n=1 Tax=Actinobaculum sp. 313 TaxID=2495645 RepID=UPI000D528A31|nr:dihydroxyacetone kinase subunit L [Actinobaculum sp. 313]AWE43022.1 dihydroxyacetone kinase [Actinobaculum sp. 313]
MESLGVAELAKLFAVVAQNMADHEETLREMDAALGDGDLGITMRKGFAALAESVGTYEGNDCGEMLMKGGMAMAGAVPSTMGTLMASALMQAGRGLRGQGAIDAAGLATLLEGLRDGVAKRGKCQEGDCTLLDVLAPAARSARAKVDDEDGGLTEVAQAARAGASEGLEATKGMVPRFGKAAVFGDKAVGLVDQGGQASVYLIEGLTSFA